MRRILMLFACMFIGQLAAESIGNVEYQLPKGQVWKVSNELKGTEKFPSSTLIYVRENAPADNPSESFAAHINEFPTDVNDKNSLQQGIEKGMQLKFTNPTATVTLLEKGPQSALYEWSVSVSGQEKVHGWTRAFSSPKETVLLTFQTDQPAKVSEARSIWLPLLKDAKIKG